MASTKTYRGVAEAFHRLRPPQETEAYEAWRRLMVEVGEAFRGENPRFEPEKFYSACRMARAEETEI